MPNDNITAAIEVPPALATARTELSRLAERRQKVIAAAADAGRAAEIITVDRGILDALERLTVAVDPCDASPSVPLVMLPVRVEAKLRPGTRMLRVRIYPDTIHIDSLRRDVSDGEIVAGQAYWTRRWADPEDPTAWGELVAAVGPNRAGWVAHVTTPTNRAQPGTAPVFGERPAEVARGTVARCLPNQFVVSVHTAGHEPIVAQGKPIPPDLPISPLAFTDEPLVDVNGLQVPLRSKWTVDFDTAVDVGMGVEVELPPGVSQISRLVVAGVRRTWTEEANAADFADLLLSHRYTDGMSLPPAGTPTNNDGLQRTPHRPDAPPAPPPLTVDDPSEDATTLAGLLGLAPGTVEGLLSDDDERSTLESTQRAANTALWYATWHPVLDWLAIGNPPEFSPSKIESGRLLHRDHVRGAGHAPALRVGAQPYGVLPVSNVANWIPAVGDTSATVVPVVARTLKRWVGAAAKVPHIKPDGSVSDKELLDMMGTSPVSTGVRVRIAADGRTTPILASVTNLIPGIGDAELTMRRAVFAQYSTAAATHIHMHSPSPRAPALGLPLVSPRDSEVIAQIITGQAPSVDSVLQALLTIAWEQVGKVSGTVVPEAYLIPLLNLVGASPTIVELASQAVKPDSVAPDPEVAYAAAKEIRATVLFDGQPSEATRLSQFEPIAQAQTSLAQVALDGGNTIESKWIGNDAIATVIQLWGVRGEVRAAMTRLGEAPIEERRIAVASTIDLASHRVDAWASGVAKSRMRAPGTPAMSLGAFGYVENLDLRPRPGASGWVQAPSPSHATAAGILASAFASNIGAKPGKQPFAIDLTSRRGPEIRRILEGIDAGQSLGALLGYQIERGLGTAAARFQLSLRELAPTNASKLDNELAEERSAMNAADVVDGLALLEKYWPDNLSGLWTALAAKPKNPYITSWSAPDTNEKKAVEAALRAAADTLDAVSDALLAESVMQYGSGNAARASAAMDATGPGGAVDPNLAVFDVRQGGRQLSHAIFTTVPVEATGWPATRPRSTAEPRAEAWAARRLGDPSSIIVSDSPRHTLAQAGWCALDLVYADSLADLERDLRAAIPALGDLPLADQRGADWPDGAISILDAATLASTLRGLVSGARSLSPDDLARIGEDNAHKRTVDVDELLDRCRRLVNGLGETLAAGAEAMAAIDPATLAIAPADEAAVAASVEGLRAYGGTLVPDPHAPTNAAWAWAAWTTMRARHAEAEELLQGVWDWPVQDPTPTVSMIVDVANQIAETVLGDGFRLLPLLAPPAGVDDFATAVTNPLFAQPSSSKIAGFLRDQATVHSGAGRVAEAQLIGRALGKPVPLTVVQLTDRVGAVGAPGTDRWLAGHLPDDVPWPAAASAHAVVELVGGPGAVGGRVAGIVFDGWVEALPFQPEPGAFDDRADPDNPLRAARATTALAVNANQASARAPQTVLSLVSPNGKRWDSRSVVDAVLAAVDLGKARLVTLEKTPGDAAILPAIYVASPWLQPSKFPDFGQYRVEAPLLADQHYSFLAEVK